MTFRELFIELADRVGRQHLPVVDDVNEIGDFLGQDAVHHQLVRRVVRDVYKANRCGYLDAEVRAGTTLDALGVIQGDVLRDEAADLDQVHLMQHIGREVADLLPFPKTTDVGDTSPDGSDGDSDNGDANNVRPMVRGLRIERRG